MTELPEGVFRLLLSIFTGGAAGLWGIHDLVGLARLRGAGRGDPQVGDRRFGYAIGIAIGVIGVVGTLRFNGLL